MPMAAENNVNMVKPSRLFLGWDQPILSLITEQLLDQFGDDGHWDMRDVVVVLPSSLAKRRLTELLALKAEQTQLVLYPPDIVTMGALPEQLYVAKYPFASDLVQNLAWMRVLQAASVSQLKLIVPVPPAKSNTAAWLELGKVLSSMHRELASDQMNFDAVVAALDDHPEQPRWEALSDLQNKYLEFLDGLDLWDVQTARLCAIRFGEASCDKRVIVASCVDLNRTQQAFLEAIAPQVSIWVAAPEDKQALFDEFGCLMPAQWQDIELEIPEDSLWVGNSPDDQAELTAACLADFGDRYHAQEITIGVPDASLVPEIEHQLDLAGVTSSFGAGGSLNQSEPVNLLRLIGRYLETRSFQAFAGLIRHPAVGNLLQATKAVMSADWLSSIDEYYQQCLPKKVDGFVNEDAKGADVYLAVTQSIDQWLRRLSQKPREISSFVQPLLNVLTDVYKRQNCDLTDPVEATLYLAAQKTSACIVGLRDIPDRLQPKFTASELIDWLVSNMSNQLVPTPFDPEAINMLGWLELALDDAPALVLTGMHDGVVPESVNADAFLPNGLRREVGMMDNERRYARDLYAMHVLLHARESIHFVVGKADAMGDPLVPSRLLMACPLAQLPGRVLHLAHEEEVDVRPALTSRWQARGGESELIIPQPRQVDPPKQISVTAFRDYLRCPYRFYLRHVLRLRSEQDGLAELDAPQFGVLLHDTLELLQGPIGACSDADEVRKFLIAHLHRIAEATYGPNPAAAVLIQIEQAELRLAAFAERQAERAAQGWEVKHVEKSIRISDNVLIGRDEQLPVIGRIDRIDYHPDSGQWAIWDYKTSENAKNPVSVHWTQKQGWQDLQLPLYRSMAQSLGITGEPTLGYITLPRQAADIGFHLANFTAAQLNEADAVAAEVASRIASADFWPESIQSVPFDDFARICQTKVQRVTAQPPTRKLHRCKESSLGVVDSKTTAAASELIRSPKHSEPELPPQLIRASAGTGKTFQLSNRLLQILLSGQEVDHILATTFTRKAAGEIMHRVLQRLATACLNPKAREELTIHLPDVDVGAANCLATLRRLTASIHRLRIGTLDSFFAQVARTFSFEMALPPGWSAMDPVQEPEFQNQSISRMLDKHDRRTLVNLVRMLAKGESGRRVSDEIRRTVNAGYAAYRTTDADAWDQLPLPSAPSESAVESALLTLDGTKLNNKKADWQLEKLHLDARSGAWERVVNHGIYNKIHQGDLTYFRKELPSDLVYALQVLAERAAAELLPIRRNQTVASYQVLDAYDEEYMALIRQARLLAFSDVTHYLSQWITENGSAADKEELANRRLEFRLDCGVHHLLLDEFQDTAPQQWQILRPLAKPLADVASSRRSMFCVGDTKQAIYGWRGGVAEVFESVAQAMPAIEQTELRESYRSSPAVIETVNEVFQNLTRHKNFGGCDAVAGEWSKSFPRHRTTLTQLEGYACLQNGPKIDRDVPLDERKLIFFQHSAKQIADLVSQSSAKIGVLLRTNADVALFISILRQCGVPASQDGGNPLTDSAAVELILSLVHLADHPGDDICLYHVATSPLAATLPVGMQNASNAPDATELANWFRAEVSRKGLGATIDQIANLLANQLAWWDQHRLEQLVRLAHQFDSHLGGRLRTFEETVEKQRVALPTEAQVSVMTVHMSKGLEFDAVFLPELEIDLVDSNSLLVLRGNDPCEAPTGVLRYMNASLQAMLPKDWTDAFLQHKQRSFTESLCLLYVAMTRAKVALYMTARPTSRDSLQQFGSLLQSVLGDKETRPAGETILYEQGNARWFETFPTQLSAAPETKAPETKVAETKVAETKVAETKVAGATLDITIPKAPQSSPRRHLQIAAPSQARNQGELVPLSGAFSYSQSMGAVYGTIIHAFFEQIQWIEDFEFDRQRFKKIAMSVVTPEELQQISVDQAIAQFEDMLHLSSVRSALSRARYGGEVFGAQPDFVHIDNERDVNLVVADQLVEGTIDRLAILYQNGRPYAAEIVDFKTDQFDPGMTLLWLDDRIEHHRPQLENYAQVVSTMFDIPRERIGTFLVMLSSDDLVRVDLGVPAPHFDASRHAVGK